MTASARRRFLRHFATQAAALATVRQAWAVPATRQRGTIDDVRHVVILMQENRSFDHYFGTLRGVQTMIARLAGHAAFAGAAAERLKMCGDCRVVDLHGGSDELRITEL